MAILQYQIYEIFKQTYGEKEANTVLEYLETKIDSKMEQNNKNVASKQDLIELELRLTEKFNKAIYRSGLIQYLAIVGSMLAILGFMNK